jgi:respiratory burst oxidase
MRAESQETMSPRDKQDQDRGDDIVTLAQEYSSAQTHSSSHDLEILVELFKTVSSSHDLEVLIELSKIGSHQGGSDGVDHRQNRQSMNRKTFVDTFGEGPMRVEYCGRMFDYMVSNHNENNILKERNTITLPLLDLTVFAQEMLHCQERTDPLDRFHHLMKIYDSDGDGYIQPNDILPLIEAAFVEMELKINKEEVHMALLAMATTRTSNLEHADEEDCRRALAFHQVRSLVGDSLDDLCLGPLDHTKEWCSKPDTKHVVPTETMIDRNQIIKQGIPDNATKDEGKKMHSLFLSKFYKNIKGTGQRTMNCSPMKNTMRKALLQILRQWRFNRPRVIWLSLYTFTNMLVFFIKFMVWKNSDKYESARAIMSNGVCFAKAFAGVATFNTGLIFFPICRKFVSSLRNQSVSQHHKLWKWIPFDDSIKFHILAGHVTMMASIGHTVAHLINFKRYSEASTEVWNSSPLHGKMNGPNPSIGDALRTLPGWTGLGMVLVMLIAYPVAAFLRRRPKYFNAFWYTHQLYILWAVMFLVHGMKQILQPAQAIWVALPGFTIYMGERLQSLLCRDECQVKIVRAETYDNTTILYTTKPKSHRLFHFIKPGSYASLNVPGIAQFEWHPFTISSAPEDQFLRFHIRCAGDWTLSLWDHVRQMEQRLTELNDVEVGKEKVVTADACRVMGTPCFREGDDVSTAAFTSSNLSYNESEASASSSSDSKIMNGLPESLSSLYIRGPYGAPAQDFMQYHHVVLIGAGIGVTPFASILRHVLLKWQWEKFYMNASESSNIGRFAPQHAHQMVEFHWVTREHESLSWFSKELTELMELDHGGILKIHQYLTAVKKDSNNECPRRLLSSLQETLKCSATGHLDILSGIQGGANQKHQTHFGRPDFEAHFQELSMATSLKGKKVGVFYCGPSILKHQVQFACRNASNKTRKEGGTRFDFHHENF